MKKTLILLLTALSLNLFSQDKMNDKQAMKEKHIDFSTHYLYFELFGLIELNGVIFENDTCQCPVMYKATIDKVELYDECTKQAYVFDKFITYGDKKIISISNVYDRVYLPSLWDADTIVFY